MKTKKQLFQLTFTLLTVSIILCACTITVKHKFDQQPIQYVVLAQDGNMLSLDSMTQVQSAPNIDYEGEVHFINKSNDIIKVERVLDDGTRTQVAMLFNDDEGGKKSVPANKGDRFVFTPTYSKDFQITPYLVRKLGETYSIDLELQFQEARSRYAKVPNEDASRSSFDIFYVPPAHIDKPRKDGGGMRGKIFKKLNDTDTDWDEAGDVAFKKHFSLRKINSGEGSETLASRYGMNSFKESFSFNLSLGGEIPGLGGVTNSFGFSKETEESFAQEEVFTFARIDQEVYELSLNKEYIDFEDDFVDAVKELTTPASVPQSEEAARANATLWDEYQKFIQDWGTHYPTSVTYGGFYLYMKTSSMKEYIESYSEEFNASNKASVEIKKIKVEREANGSYGTTNSYENKEKDSKEIFMFRGGSGAKESWNVPEDAAQPVAMEIERLHELFYPTYFKNEISETELAGKRKMLGFALDGYIGPKVEDGKENLSKMPVYYEVIAENWSMEAKDEGGRADIYGMVRVEVHRGDLLSIENEYIKGKTVWKKLGNEDVTEVHTGRQFEPIEPSPLLFSIAPDKAGDYYFDLFAVLVEEDDEPNFPIALLELTMNSGQRIWNRTWVETFRGDDDIIGLGSVKKYLKTIPEDGSPVEIQLPFEGMTYYRTKGEEDWKVYVNARARRLPLEKFGLRD
jgi:hypothetical protein